MINYAYWLSNIPGIGIRTRNRLIGAAGSAREIYGLTEKQLLLIPGVEEKHAAGIMESKKRDYDTEYESMAERGIFFLSREEQLFPQRLAAIPDAPEAVYVEGEFFLTYPVVHQLRKKHIPVLTRVERDGEHYIVRIPSGS